MMFEIWDAVPNSSIAAAGLRHSRAPSNLQPAILIPKSRTAPLPRFRVENQTRLCRIALDVFARLQFMLAVADVGVPIICLPKLAAPFQQPIRLLRRVFLPALQNLRHWGRVHL